MNLTLSWLDSLETAIIPDPIRVTPDTPLDEVIGLITHARSICYLPSLESNPLENAKKEGRGSCVIVVDDNRPIGIITERNIIRWIATGKDTTKVKVAEVMSQPIVTLKHLEQQDIFAVIDQFRQYSIRHLPIVNDDKLVGLITYDTVRSCLKPGDLLQFRKVSEVMNSHVISTTAQTSLLRIAQLMANHHISCVVIIDETLKLTPVGIITERDLVQFKNLGLDLQDTLATTVMSSPLLTVRGEDTLTLAHETMECYHIGRLIITGNHGEFVGLVTRTNILQVLKPLEVYNVLEVLQNKVKQLQNEKIKLLENRNLDLEKQVEDRNKKLFYREKEFQVIVENTPDIIFRIDLDLRYLYINAAIQKLLGVSPSDLIGKHPEDLGVDQALINLWRNVIQKAIETREEQVSEYPFPKIDSSTWHQTRLVPEYTPDGTLISFLGISRDITQQKLVEEQLRQQVELEKLLYQTTVNIRKSLSLDEILKTTVNEIRLLLKCDRVLVYQFNPDKSGNVVAESVASGWDSLLKIHLEDTCFKAGGGQHYLEGKTTAINNIETAEILPCHQELLSRFQVKANLVVPIIVTDSCSQTQLWGLLIAHQCSAPRQWISSELTLLDQLAVPISIAIQQSQLYQQIQYELNERYKAESALIKFNSELEQRVRERTLALSQTNQQLLEEIKEHKRTEKKLHRQNIKVELFTDITLNIRQSLQLEKILQTTVTEIRQILDCDRVLIYRIAPNGSGKIITESVIKPELSILNQKLKDDIFSSYSQCFDEHRTIKAINNIEDAKLSDKSECFCMRELMQQFQVKSKLIVPVFQNDQLWGLMLAHQCSIPRKWTEFEIEIMQQISDQVGIAIAQAQLLMDLQESQEQLQDLFENANDLIQLISPENGHFIYVNRAWKETLKYSDEDLKNLSIFDIIEEQYTDEYQQIFEQLKTGAITKHNSIETKFLTKTGETVILEGSANCRVESGKPTVIRAFLRDVTARKQAEQQLQTALQELTYHKLALDELAIVAITNANGVITYVNQKFCQLFQYSPEEILGKTHRFINSGYHPHNFFKQLWLTISKGKVWQGEIRDQAKNGDYYWVDSTIVPFVNQEGQPFQYLSIMLDITERKLAETKLLELNQLKQAILDGANYAIICTDVNGIIQVWNRAAENLLGYQAQEVISKKTPAIIHNSQEVIERSYSLSLELGTKIEPGFEVFIAKSRLGQKEEREWIYVHKDGTHFPVLLSMSNLQDQTGNISGFLGIAQDLRERKRTEAEIKVAQERFQLAIQAAQDGFWDWDFIAGTIYYSPRWKEMIGYNNDELLNELSSWEKVIFEEDRVAALKLIEDYNQGKIDRFQAVQRFHHKNGSTVYILSRAIHLKDEQGKVIRMVGAHTDITELQKAQEVLKQQLAAIEAAIDGIAILKDGQFIYLNQAHVQLFGYTHPKELLGRSWVELYKPEQLDYFQQHIFPVLAQQRHWQGEATAKRKDGSTFTEEISLTLTDDDLLICVCRDVTERLKAEEKIKASLLEKEVLLREIHHRVKNNLYVISNLLDLQADTLEDGEQRNLFAESQNRIQTMVLIHEQLYKSDDLSQVNFANYIQNLVEKIGSSYQSKNCQVKISLDVEPVTLSLETAIPCGLLINELVTNSFKYAFPNSEFGEIKIELKLDQQQQIHLKISDNGIGISRDVDWQDSPSLGLRLVNILGDQLEAAVEVDCSQGTSFTLTFQEQGYN